MINDCIYGIYDYKSNDYYLVNNVTDFNAAKCTMFMRNRVNMP